MAHRFRNRREAGQQLAQALAQEGFQGSPNLVLGIPRGGVVVADAVARALGAPLDVVPARKLRAPYEPEVAIGAVGGDRRVLIIAEDVAWATGTTPEYLEREIRHQRAQIEQSKRLYRGDRPPPALRGRTLLVVDDGIASGFTVQAALEELRREQPERLVVAVPVASCEGIASLRSLADEVVSLTTSAPAAAVRDAYVDFPPISDDEVVRLLRHRWAPDADSS